MPKTRYQTRKEIMIDLAMKLIAESTASVNAENSEPSAENFDNSGKIYSTPIETMAANKMTDVEYAIEISETIVHTDVHSQASTERINVNEMPEIVEYEFEISNTNIQAHEHLQISEEIMSVSEMAENVEYEIQLSESNVQSELNSEIGIEAEEENNNDHSYSKIKKLSKQNRMNGSAYQGYKRSRTNHVTFGIERPNRKLGETCISEYCVKSKMRKCSQFSQKIRDNIFTEFWKMNWQQKQMYVCNLVKEVPKKRIYTESSSRRTTSRCYYLKATNGDMLQVCQKMFLNTLGIKEKMMRIWLKNSLPHGLQINPVETSNTRKTKLIASEKFLNIDKRQSHMKQFFELYPKLESHYCRKDSKKIYLQTASDSKTALYNKEYVKECIKSNIQPLSITVFKTFLKELNYSIFKPRKDQCDTCTEYKVGNLDSSLYNEHRARVEKARKEMETDRKLAAEGQIIMLCMDVQAVKLCPQLDASSQYYKMKLQIHNFTIYNVVTHDSTNYMWDETQGHLVASCFTTIICSHIKRIAESDASKTPIVIYSDGCGYQNRNEVLSNALCNLSIKYQIIIEQKYLEKGHTQNQCDSTHSLIERKLKGKIINLPSEFVALAKEARKKPHPLEIHLLNYEYFLNYDVAGLKKWKSIRPGKLTGDPTVNQLRCLKYTPNGGISFKLNFDDEFKPLPQRRSSSTITNLEPTRMYCERLTISQSKYKHLQDLKALIPSDTHAFYDNIQFHADPPKSKK